MIPIREIITNQAFIILVLLFLSFFIFFNRCPKRKIPKEKRIIVSPADGKVLFVKNKMVVVFLGVKDVHVQRIPISGKVISIKKYKGGHAKAFLDKAAQNQKIVTILKTSIGDVTIKQMSGSMARRIRNFLYVGQEVVMGEKLGKILFGSRVEITMPSVVKVYIKKGDNVRGGETIIARY